MTVRIGVVGCGWWATAAHLPGVVGHPDAELTAIADPSEANRSRAARSFGVTHAFADAETMLDRQELDAVVVATPAAHHYAPAAAALARGLNVLIEKPMVIDPAEGRALVELAAKNHCELAVGYTWHFSPQVIRLKAEIAAGKIGEIEHVSSFFGSVARDLYRGQPQLLREALGFPLVVPDSKTYADPAIAGGGQVQTQLTHSLALALHLTGLRVGKVAAFLQSFELDVDLADVVSLSFTNGAVGSIDSAGSMLPGQQEILECRILGRGGHVLLDVTKGTAAIHGPDGAVEELPVILPGEGDAEKVDNLILYPEKAPVENLIDMTLGRAGNVNSGTLGLRAVEVIDAIYRSAREGRVISLGDAP